MTTRRVRHVAELDSIRGVALIVVLLSHFWLVWPTWTFTTVFAHGGFIGVDLFFVLSGFLITALLLDEQARTGAIRVGSFLWRRALRLIPALWFFLIAQAIYAVVESYPPFGSKADEVASLRAGGLFVMNWHTLWNPIGAGDLSPLWSLSIEMQFYVVWPFVVLALLGLHRSPRTVLVTLGVLIVAVTLRRYQLYETQGWYPAYLRSDSHIDGLMVGALTGCAWVRGWTPDRLPRWLLWAAVAVGGGVLTQIRADHRFAYAGGTTLFLAASATAVLVAVTTARPKLGPGARALALVGRYSYGLYLWHFAVFWAATRWSHGWSDEARVASAAAVVAVGVIASRHLVELPALRLNRTPRRPPTTWVPPTFSGPAGGPPNPRPG